MATANVIAANIATIRAARRQRTPKELIKAATIATALDKQTGAILGFAVKSNSTEQYYNIQTEIIGGERVYFCDCEAHLWGCTECAHIKAVKSVLAAQAELATFLDNLDCFFLAASRWAFSQARPNTSKYAYRLADVTYEINKAQEEAAEAEIRAEVAQATIAQAEAILKEERRLAPLNGQSHKVETTPWGTSVLMR